MPNFKAPTIQEVDIVSSPTDPDVVGGIASDTLPATVPNGDPVSFWAAPTGALVISGQANISLDESPAKIVGFSTPDEPSESGPIGAAAYGRVPGGLNVVAVGATEQGSAFGAALFTQGSTEHDTEDFGRPVKIGGFAQSTPPAAVANGDRVNAWLSLSGAQVVDGGVAHDAVDSGNPVKIGGRASNTGLTPAVANGDRVDSWFGINGQIVAAVSSGAQGSDAEGNSLAFMMGPSSTTGLKAAVAPYVFNGTTWDRRRGDTTGAYAVGNVANDAVDAGNPVKIGGVFQITPTAVSIGDRAQLWTTNLGAAMIGAWNQAVGDAFANTNAALLPTSGGVNSALTIFPFVYNGSTWDRYRKADRTSRIPTSAATTNATSAKNAAGDLRSIVAVNTTAALIYLKFCNVAVAPTPGTTPVVFTVPLAPNNVPTVVNLPDGGLYFSTGIGYYLCTGAADADATAVAAGAVTSLSVTFD